MLGASKGQSWTRQLALAALAYTRPSSPSRFIACPASHLMFDGILFFLAPSLTRERQVLLVLGIIAWSSRSIALSWVVAFACGPC